MRRHPALVELSRDHHQALAVALRLRRATGESAGDAREAFLAYWNEGGAVHFDIEEAAVLPALGGRALCGRIRDEHRAIRGRAAALEADAQPPPAALATLGEALADHVRLEERELFPLLEEELDDAALARVGAECRALEAAGHGGIGHD